MRGHAARAIAQRGAIAQSDQREELVELAVAVDGERAAAQFLERERLLDDDPRQENAHGYNHTLLIGDCGLLIDTLSRGPGARHPARSLRDPDADWRRGHGRGLPRSRHAARAQRRDQDRLVTAVVRPAVPRAVRARSAHDLAAEP